VAARVLLAAVIASALAACGGTLVDHGGTGILGDPATCGDGQVVCGGRCVAQSPETCGASCSVCGEPPVNATGVCNPIGAGGHDGVCGFQCADGLLLCASVQGGPVDGCCAPALVASGFDFTCASSTTGEVHCFGAGNLGQLGNGATVDRATSTKLRGFTSPISALAAGDGHACAISGAVTKCWGDGPAFGAPGAELDPWDVASLAGATEIAAGATHTCGIVGGNVICVGAGAIAGGGFQSAAALGGTPLRLAAGDGFTCALVAAGPGSNAVKCWGNDAFGQLGDGGAAPGGASETPVAAAGVPATIQSLSAGTQHACAAAPTTDNQQLWCWGSNAGLQLGPLGTGPQPTLFPDSALHRPIASVAAGGHATCAVVNDSGTYRPYCWSSDSLVAGMATPATPQNLDGKPNPLPPSTGAAQPAFSAGASHTCYVDATQTPPRLACFGLGARGRLGDGSIADSPIPVLVIDR
jgi:hypothetical protein